MEQNSDGTGVYFRQSWVNNFLLCNDRARLDVETDETNEAAALGTALHAGIEAGLRGTATTPTQVSEVAIATLIELESHFTYDDLDRDRCVAYLRHWSQMLRTQPEFMSLRNNDNAVIEEYFCVPVDRMGDVTMYWEGTADAADVPNCVIDWKTTGRKYQRWEKQRWAVQPTVYAEAARQYGWVNNDIVDFKFVVFEKSLSTSAPEVVTVTRGPGHTAWLTRMLWRAYDLRQVAEWPLNDAHALCSQKWCPVWDKCKGLHVRPDFQA